MSLRAVYLVFIRRDGLQRQFELSRTPYLSPVTAAVRAAYTLKIFKEVLVVNTMVKNLLLWLVIAAVLLSVFNNFNMKGLEWWKKLMFTNYYTRGW